MFKFGMISSSRNAFLWFFFIILFVCSSLGSGHFENDHPDVVSSLVFQSDPSSSVPPIINAPNVVLSQIYEINDDTVGNSWGDGDHLVDAGEVIELRLRLENTGDQAVTGVYGKLSSTNPSVIISSSNQSYTNIPAGESRLSTSYYLLEFNSNFTFGAIVNFTLEITALEGSWFDSFTLEISGVPLPAFYGYIVTSESNGDLNADNDGVIDPGEIAYFRLFIENSGNSTFFDVDGYLSTSDPLIIVSDGFGSFGTISGGGGIDYGSFAISVSGACFENYAIPFNLSLVDFYNNEWMISFDIVVSGFSDYLLLNITFFEYFGDDDELLDAGETCVTEISFRNIGNATAKDVSIHLWSNDSLIEFYYSYKYNMTLEQLDVGFSDTLYSSAYWRFDISDRAQKNQSIEFFIVITDSSGAPAKFFYTTLQIAGVAEYELFTYNFVEYCYYDDGCNTRIDAGDSFIANISIINTGAAIGNEVSVYLYSGDKFIEFYYENGTGYEYGSLEVGEIDYMYGYYYWEFTISERARAGHVIYFTIVVRDASEREWFFSASLTVQDGPNTFFYTTEGILITAGCTVGFLAIVLYQVVKKNKTLKQRGSSLSQAFQQWQKDQKIKRADRKRHRVHSRTQQQKEREVQRQERERERIARVNTNEKLLLEKFENILKMSESVDIALVAKSLGLSRAQLFEKLIHWQEMLPFKIDGQYIEVDDTEDFSESIRHTIDEISKYYSCFYCGFPIERSSTDCPDCKNKVLFCAVCKLPISFGDDIGSCPHCEAKGHIIHMQEWLKTQRKCPICQQQLTLRGLLHTISEQNIKK